MLYYFRKMHKETNNVVSRKSMLRSTPCTVSGGNQMHMWQNIGRKHNCAHNTRPYHSVIPCQITQFPDKSHGSFHVKSTRVQHDQSQNRCF